jgi:hypothetical protein
MFIDDLLKPVEDMLEKLIDSGYIWLILGGIVLIAFYLLLKGIIFK